jgi:hypothetical protein
MSRREKRSQKSKIKSRKLLGQDLEVKGAGGCAVLESSTFDLRLLTFLSAADHVFRSFQGVGTGSKPEAARGKGQKFTTGFL